MKKNAISWSNSLVSFHSKKTLGYLFPPESISCSNTRLPTLCMQLYSWSDDKNSTITLKSYSVITHSAWGSYSFAWLGVFDALSKVYTIYTLSCNDKSKSYDFLSLRNYKWLFWSTTNIFPKFHKMSLWCCWDHMKTIWYDLHIHTSSVDNYVCPLIEITFQITNVGTRFTLYQIMVWLTPHNLNISQSTTLDRLQSLLRHL